MRVSVILSTYNQPEWLLKVLWGYACQTRRPTEIVIADDGSTDSTREVIHRQQEATGLYIQHVWQEDEGFRKTRILNQAILKARGDYLLFSDGDCLPRHDFVAAHLHAAQQGRFLSGGALRLPMEASRAISPAEIAQGTCFTAKWLRTHAHCSRRRMIKATVHGATARLLNRLPLTRPTFNGGNSSCWRDDAMAVGGFDERMQYGGEDREFGERLCHLGIKPRQVRYTAACLHLEHTRSYVEPEMVELNRQIRHETAASHRVATEHGLRRAS